MYNSKPAKQEMRQPYPWEVYPTTDEKLDARVLAWQRLASAKRAWRTERQRFREADVWGWSLSANRRYDAACDAVWMARWRLALALARYEGRRLAHAAQHVGIALAVVVLFVVLGYLALVTSGPNSAMWP